MLLAVAAEPAPDEAVLDETYRLRSSDAPVRTALDGCAFCDGAARLAALVATEEASESDCEG